VPLKIAVFISGRGSNLNAIIQAISDKTLDAEIQCVVSNDPEAPGLLIAEQHGLKTFALSHKGMKRRAHEDKILEHLKQYNIDFIVLAGYMRLIGPEFLKQFEDKDGGFYRVVNIHPSLLPSFPGTSGYEDAYNYGVKVSGVTVHLVDEELDRGIILAQVPFPRFPDDTLTTFKARGLSVEHALYPAVLQTIASEGVKVNPKKKVESAT
jgi:phosphoribosylglycinamide formyltransferase-1